MGGLVEPGPATDTAEADVMITALSWNIAMSSQAADELLTMDADVLYSRRWGRVPWIDCARLGAAWR